MTSSISNINAFSYSSMASSGVAGKLYVPVSKSALLYSNFDHVSGIAAKSNQQGVSISKIRILNSMIERLSALKNEPKQSVTDISDESAEVLIKQYQEQIKQTIKTQPYITAGASPLPGEIFQIDA